MDENSDCSRILVKRVSNLILSPVDRVINDYTEIILLMYSDHWYHALPSVLFMTSVTVALKLHINSAEFWSRFFEKGLLRGILKFYLNVLVYSFSLFAWLLLSELIYCNCLAQMETIQQVAWLEKIVSKYKTDNKRQIIFWISLIESTYMSLCFSFLFARPYYRQLRLSYLLPHRLLSRLKRKNLPSQNKEFDKDNVKTEVLEGVSENDGGTDILYDEIRPKKNRPVKNLWEPPALSRNSKTKKLLK